MITLVDQNAAHSIVDCFRNSAMLGREDRQSTRHRFEHRVRNPFLVPVATEFARMQENVRLKKFLAQSRLGKKTGEPHPLADAELARETSQLLLHRSFACDREAGRRIFLLERGEGAQAGLEPLFLDQATGLQEASTPRR